jgi:hypothetical protein
MRDFDPIKERSEKKLDDAAFLKSYNEDLPEQFPKASRVYLKEFKNSHPSLFKDDGAWSLDQHRKKFMDWLPQHIKYLET